MQKTVNAKKYLMDKILKEKGLEYLKNKKMYKRNIMDFLLILDFEFWKDERYKHLLCSNIWYSSLDNIINILTLKYWDIPKYAHLLSPTIFDYNAKNIQENIELFSRLDLVSYLKISIFRRTANQNLLLMNALQARCIPVIVPSNKYGDTSRCLNSIFNLSYIELREKYGIDLKLLEANEEEMVKNR